MRGPATWRPRRVPVTAQLAVLTGTVFGIQGLTALLTAKWLGATDRGVLVVVQTVSFLLLLVGAAGLMAGTRVLLADPAHGVSLRDFLGASRWLVLLQAVLAATVGSLAVVWLVPDATAPLVVVFVLLCAVGLRGALNREALHGIGRHREAVISELLAAAVPLLVVAVAYLRGSLSVLVVLGALAFGLLVQWAVQLAIMRRHRLFDSAEQGPRRTDLALLRTMVVFSLPGLAAAIGAAVAGRTDRLILAHFHGPASVGVYSVAATLADIPWVLPTAVTAVIVRGVAQSGSTATHMLWWRRVILATAGLAVVTYAAGWWVIERFLGEEFRGGSTLLAILLVGALALASQQVDLAVCSGRNDLGASARSAAVGLVFGLTAYGLLIPPWGAVGAASGTVITYLAMAVSARWYVNKHVRQESA